MKNPIFLFAVAAIAATASPRVIRAQETSTAPVTMDAKSGYDLFLQAAKLIQPPPKNEVVTDQLAPDEKLRRQRLGAARNAPALDKLREALNAGIVLPASQLNDGRFVNSFPEYSVSMEFPRYLAQESAVRASDGDTMGAAQSGLDAMQLGAQIGHGLRINAITGIAISEIGRKYLQAAAPALNAAQSRALATRLDAISEQTPQMTDVLQAEQAYNLRSLSHLEDELSDPAKRAQAEAEAKAKAEKQAATGKRSYDPPTMTSALLKFPAAQIKNAFQKSFDEATTRAALPYASLRDLTKSGVPYVDFANTMNLVLPGRFALARDVVVNRQLAAALRLRAAKLETGQYPETFDAGTDPFSPTFAPLIYKREADAYVLYSVGPDGKDEGGAEIQTLTTDYRTRIKSVTGDLTLFSTGDILAPVL